MRNAKQIVAVILFIAAAVSLTFFYFRQRASGDVDIKIRNETVEISVRIPQTGNNALDASVKKYGEFLAAEFAETYGPGSFSDEEYELLGFKEGRRYGLLIVGKPWRYGTISGILLERYTYTGGAHGATDYIRFSYDAKGIPLALGDLFVQGSDYLERIASYVAPVLKEELESKNIFLANMFETGTKADPGNYMIFLLERDGIVFVFQEYQVAPYAAGVSRVTVPYEALEDILNPTYF